MKFKHILSLSVLWTSQTTLATLTPSLERGDRNVYYTSPRGVSEVCVIPKHFPEAKYTESDLKIENKLCSLNFYSETNSASTNEANAVAICPKLNSTNPGVDIFSIPGVDKLNKSDSNYLEELTKLKSDFEKINCEDKTDSAEKIGKYKNSTSCSYAPSLLAYYHVSRILGGIGNVPPAVLRSMDIQTHKSLASKALSITKSSKVNDLASQPLIYQTWYSLNNFLNAGLNGSKKDQLLSDDGQQSYGAVIINPKGEEFYKEFFTAGADRALAFKDKNDVFKLVKNSISIEGIIGSAPINQTSLQKMIAMQDVTEFILLDHILDQQDRFGNIAFQTVTAYLKEKENGEVELERTKKMEKYEEDKKQGQALSEAFSVKAMVLKDNDCGVSKENRIKAAGLLKEISHMNPDTYNRLLDFSQTVRTPEAAKFFKSNMMLTTTDYNEMVANIDDAVKILKSNCQSGKLKLDLDIATYFTKGPVTNWSCE